MQRQTNHYITNEEISNEIYIYTYIYEYIYMYVCTVYLYAGMHVHIRIYVHVHSYMQFLQRNDIISEQGTVTEQIQEKARFFFFFFGFLNGFCLFAYFDRRWLQSSISPLLIKIVHSRPITNGKTITSEDMMCNKLLIPIEIINQSIALEHI